jgi:cell division protein ZapA
MNRISIQIADQTYNLVTDEPEEKVKKIAGYVDLKMKEITKRAPSLPIERVAILSSLEIAEELFLTKEEVEKRVSTWIERIDKAV